MILKQSFFFVFFLGLPLWAIAFSFPPLSPDSSSSRRQHCSNKVSQLTGALFLVTQLQPEKVQAKVVEGILPEKPVTIYPDFTLTPSGLQYKEVKTGSGNVPEVGDRVVIDWEGYTIGYYGRPFELKKGIKGSAFENADDLPKEFLRFTLGRGQMIPGIEEALSSMKVGAVRQVVIPPGSLSYPKNYNPKVDQIGPKPTTFSGERALDFVLKNNGLVDKTLLFNLELKRVDKPGQRGFKG